MIVTLDCSILNLVQKDAKIMKTGVNTESFQAHLAIETTPGFQWSLVDIFIGFYETNILYQEDLKNEIS